ncbi:MAG: hypothetical protein AABX02_03295 [archaeon]
MKNNILASLMIMALVAMSGMVVANESTVNAEFEMHYLPDADGIAWSAWDNGANAFVFASNEPKSDKKLYTISLVQSLNTKTTVQLIENRHVEKGVQFRSYKIVSIDYHGIVPELVVQKIQIERSNDQIIQRLIDVDSQELVKEVVYDVKKNKSRVYEMIEGEWTKTGKHTGYATLRVHTEDGVLVSDVIPPAID